MVHTLRMDNYTPIPRKLVLGTNSSFGTESIKIERGAGWDGLNLTATWHIPGREEPLRVALLDGDAMDVPPEVTKEAKDGVLVLAGLASGVQRASCNVEYLILEQAGVYGGADAEPTPELAAQVLEAALQAKADAEAAAGDAAAAKANANKAQADAEKAQQAADKAAAEAAKAGPYAEAARAAQEAAESARDEAIAAQQAAENAAAAAAASKSAADTLAAEAARAAQAAENSKAAANNAAGLAGENATAAQQAAATAIAAANDAGQIASDAAASKAAAEAAAKAAQDAQTAAAAAKAEAVKAQEAAQTAAKSAQDAQAAAVAAQKDAAASKAAAANSAIAAKTSEDAAAKSAADAGNTAKDIKDSMAQISENKEAVSQLKEDTAALKKRQNVLVGSETGNPVSCNDAYSAPLCGLIVYGKSTQDGTPSPDNPVPIVSAGDDGSVAVKVTGKNLFPVITNANISKINKPTGGERYGYLFYVPAQSSVTASGNADIGMNCFVGDFDIKTQTYTQKAQLVSEKGGTYTAKLQSGWHVIYIANDYLPTILIKLNDAKIQLEIGTKATAYSPYREQLLTLPTPNSLPGIPVASGGNYTDPQGQQWVCDEVDLERGVKVQRVDKAAFDSTKTLAEQNAILTTPIETPLTPAEIAAYKALTTYAPDTVVQASDGAGIKLDYQRDVNLVVKNLEDAIASMTTT
nr:MAG TPA: hypothetical protein [Caudoviricetes sp.]